MTAMTTIQWNEDRVDRWRGLALFRHQLTQNRDPS